jgi:hypothetical protein
MKFQLRSIVRISKNEDNLIFEIGTIHRVLEDQTIQSVVIRIANLWRLPNSITHIREFAKFIGLDNLKVEKAIEFLLQNRIVDQSHETRRFRF